MLNNKGQSLVLFVLFLPIMLIILILVIDIGNAIVLKNKLKSINNIVLEYGLDNMDKVDLENELIELVNLNIVDIDDVEVNVDNNKIYLELEKEFDGIFSGFIDVSVFDIDVSYVGYIENGEKRIEKMGD